MTGRAWRRKSSFVFGLSSVVAGIVLSQMIAYESNFLWGADWFRNALDYCAGLFRRNETLYLIVTIALNSLVLCTLASLVFNVIKQMAMSRIALRKIRRMRDRELSVRLACRFDCPADRLIVINDPRALAMTIGFGKPRIVLSTGLLSLLDERELQAVFDHEHAHLVNRDPVKLLALKILSQAFGYVPLTRWAYSNYRILSELTADEHAIVRSGSELWLAGAMLKLIRNSDRLAANPVAAGFADGSVNYRLKQLLEPQASMPVRLGWPAAAISVNVLTLLFVLTVLAGT